MTREFVYFIIAQYTSLWKHLHIIIEIITFTLMTISWQKFIGMVKEYKIFMLI